LTDFWEKIVPNTLCLPFKPIQLLRFQIFSIYPRKKKSWFFHEVQKFKSPITGLFIVQLKEVFSPDKIIKGFASLGEYWVGAFFLQLSRGGFFIF